MFNRLTDFLKILHPRFIIRASRLGARRIAEFRATYGREPTHDELDKISSHVEQEINHSAAIAQKPDGTGKQ